MSLLAEIRHRFGYRALARQGQRMPPARPLRSLAQVDSIGMLAPSDNEQDFSCILDYAFRLQQEQGKKTFVCTYNESKVAPAYLVARRDVTLLRPADLNWKMRPVSPSAETDRLHASAQPTHGVDHAPIACLDAGGVLRFGESRHPVRPSAAGEGSGADRNSGALPQCAVVEARSAQPRCSYVKHLRTSGPRGRHGDPIPPFGQSPYRLR